MNRSLGDKDSYHLVNILPEIGKWVEMCVVRELLVPDALSQSLNNKADMSTTARTQVSEIRRTHVTT